MKIRTVLLGCVLGLNGFVAAAAETRAVYDSSGKEIPWEQMTADLERSDIIALGEEHYTPSIQAAQAQAIRDASLDRPIQGLTVGWEFLNSSEQKNVQDLFAQFTEGKITGQDFLKQTQKTDSDSYLPILEATRDLKGTLWATNLSRAEKAPVTKGGIEAADPTLLPPNFEMGSEAYRERFAEAMGSGHIPPEKLANYFAAQCLTDDVMAYQLLGSPTGDRRFLVVGAFHTDYRQGVVARLKKRAPDLRVTTVRFMELQAKDELPELTDERYGPLADFVVVIRVEKPAESQ